MNEFATEYINPLAVTYLADRNEIVISGFRKMETMTADDVEGTNYQEGDICLTDDDGDIVGFICLMKYFQ